jgi:hypothetical protein
MYGAMTASCDAFVCCFRAWKRPASGTLPPWLLRCHTWLPPPGRTSQHWQLTPGTHRTYGSEVLIFSGSSRQQQRHSDAAPIVLACKRKAAVRGNKCRFMSCCIGAGEPRCQAATMLGRRCWPCPGLGSGGPRRWTMPPRSPTSSATSLQVSSTSARHLPSSIAKGVSLSDLKEGARTCRHDAVHRLRSPSQPCSGTTKSTTGRT